MVMPCMPAFQITLALFEDFKITLKLRDPAINLEKLHSQQKTVLKITEKLIYLRHKQLEEKIKKFYTKILCREKKKI